MDSCKGTILILSMSTSGSSRARVLGFHSKT
jgi:hypothetical protein